MSTPALPFQIHSADTQSQMLLIRGFFLALLWISIVLMLIPNRIRISMLMPIQRIPDPDSHQDDADPHADHTTNFTHVGQIRFFLLLVTALPVYNVLSFSLVSEMA